MPVTAVHQPQAIRILNSAALPAPGGHYSHVCIAAGLAHIAGQLPVLPDGTPMAGHPFDDQAAQILKNLDACLQAAGLGPPDLVQVRIYLTNMDNWPRFNEHYARWLGNHRPARIIVGAASLHFGVDIEVEAVALAGAPAGRA